MKRTPKKKLAAFRLSDVVRRALESMAKRTNKSKTRLVEEAVLLHAKEL